VRAFVPLTPRVRAPARRRGGVLLLGKSNQFLRFDQTFERTLGWLNPSGAGRW
jgi:hypothetical protein